MNESLDITDSLISLDLYSMFMKVNIESGTGGDSQNKTMHIWSINFQQCHKEYTMGKGQSLR